MRKVRIKGKINEGGAIPPGFCTSTSKIRVKPHFKSGGIESFFAQNPAELRPPLPK
jgi:hypothetical protein